MTDVPESPMPKGIGAAETVEALKRIAARLEGSANAAVAAGFRTCPDPELMRDIKILDNVSLLLELLLPNWPEVRALVRRLDRQSGRAA